MRGPVTLAMLPSNISEATILEENSLPTSSKHVKTTILKALNQLEGWQPMKKPLRFVPYIRAYKTNNVKTIINHPPVITKVGPMNHQTWGG